MSPKLAGLIVALTGLGGLLKFWPELQPVIEFWLASFGWLVMHARAQAAGLSLLAGATVSGFLPQWLPPVWDKRKSELATGAACTTLTITVYLVLVCYDLRTGTWSQRLAPHDVVIAGIAGTGGLLVVIPLLRALYRLIPQAKPASMKPNGHESGEGGHG